MMEAINKNEGIISLIGLFFTILTGIFSEKKWIAIIIFLITVVVVIIIHLKKKGEQKNFSSIQERAKILFIDDKDCQIVINLKRNNFDVKKIDDVSSPATDIDVQWANIIFVDYKDVGKKLFGKKEGLGLINELRRVYGDKKRYVIYSTVQDFDGLVSFPYIRKNATYDEYISLITTEIAKL